MLLKDDRQPEAASRGPAGWLHRSLLFFGGKGGVGKTTSATAFALLAARAGRRTLLVSTDPAHSTSDILERALGAEERPVEENLWAIEIDPEREARTYIDRVRENLQAVVKSHMRKEIERQIEIARVSPGAEEAALFDRIADLARSGRDRFDLVIFDTAPTGHTLRLLTLPELMEAWVEGLLERRKQINHLSRLWRNMTLAGTPDEEEKDPIRRVLEARRRKFVQARRLLLDPAHTAFIFVLNPERLPILETRKAATMLRHHQIPLGGLIVNRVLPEGVESHPFLAARKRQERSYLDEIDRSFPDLPQVRLPLLERDVVGLEELGRVVAQLREAVSG